ncbi:DAO-domain-containing protein [Desarmillaria tabescens]|uniref:DAO-domain-containing protein n=1 Tax=Armillaria tabescens TaxID=1929756 RepID=A0AA39N6K9_ARMTA|nr:DAO-domain-containing protein [Desarmillaria tabescens]KAK0459782.1 DAO-domain-containing protein [Desarmillaria tabescens]
MDNNFPKQERQSLSYWLQGVRSNPLLDHRTTEELPEEADVVIIGSGATGAMTALELLSSPNPPKSIVMLEARELCSGATGRNAGHCKPDQWRGFAKYQSRFSTEQALKILANEQEAFERVVAYIHKYNVKCDLWVGKTLDVIIDEEIATKAAGIFERYRAAGGNVDHVEHITDRTEATKRSRINHAVSVFSWDAASLYPWKLVDYIITTCLSKGLNLQTWTPVNSVSLSDDSRNWVVATERGSIVTPTVVHATNAYASALLPEFENIIKPTPHMCNKVIPPRSWSGTKALQNTYGVLCPGDALYSINPRPTSDGIILFGGSNPGQHALLKYIEEHPDERTNDGLTNFEPITKAVDDFIQSEFSDWGPASAPGEGLDYAWSGIIGYSADGLPYVGPIPGKPGQWICAGHNGHGMTRIFTAAPGLVKLIQGGTWADTGLPECFELTPERLNRVSKLNSKLSDRRDTRM